MAKKKITRGLANRLSGILLTQLLVAEHAVGRVDDDLSWPLAAYGPADRSRPVQKLCIRCTHLRHGQNSRCMAYGHGSLNRNHCDGIKDPYHQVDDHPC